MDVDELRDQLQALFDRGLLDRDFLDFSAPTENPMPPCRRCGKPADGLDYLCTRCRAIWACDQLVNDLTNALECFLENRWAPHEYERPRPAYYHTGPNFDG